MVGDSLCNVTNIVKVDDFVSKSIKENIFHDNFVSKNHKLPQKIKYFYFPKYGKKINWK